MCVLNGSLTSLNYNGWGGGGGGGDGDANDKMVSSVNVAAGRLSGRFLGGRLMRRFVTAAIHSPPVGRGDKQVLLITNCLRTARFKVKAVIERAGNFTAVVKVSVGVVKKKKASFRSKICKKQKN